MCSRKLWPVLLREGRSTICGVPDNVPNPTKPTSRASLFNTGKDVICSSTRLILRRSG